MQTFEMRDGEPTAQWMAIRLASDLPADGNVYTQLTWFSKEPSGKYRERMFIGEKGKDLVVSSREQDKPPTTTSEIRKANRAKREAEARREEADRLFRQWLDEYGVSNDKFQEALAEAKRAKPDANFDEQRVLAFNIAVLDTPMETQLAWIARGRKVTQHSKAQMREFLEGKSKDKSTRFEENERYFVLVEAVAAVRAAGLSERAQRAQDAILARVFPDQP